MKTSITYRLIQKVEIREKAYEIRDSNLKGFILRVQPSGMLTFYVEYAYGKRMHIGRIPEITPDQARKKAQETLAKARLGEDPTEEKQQKKAHTFKAFIEEVYKPWAEANLKSPENTLGRIKHSLKTFHERRLYDISPIVVERWRSDRLKDGVTRSTINRELSDLNSSLQKAVNWGYLKEHPFKAHVKKYRADNLPIVRYLTIKENIALRTALEQRETELREGRKRGNEWRKQRHYELYPNLDEQSFADRLKPLVLLSLNTGLRRGEAFNLEWKDIDFNTTTLTVMGQTAKSGKTRHIPLNEEVLSVLKNWHNQSSGMGLVFPGEGGRRLDNVNKTWKSTLKRAEIYGFRWHDLRHTFASNLVMAGVDLNTVRELLGHSDIEMTLRYAHLAPEHKASAVEKLCQPVELNLVERVI